MYRTQLYDPLSDPKRAEFLNYEVYSNENGYYIPIQRNSVLFRPGSVLWKFYHSIKWYIIKSIFCRLVMILYSSLLIVEVSNIFDQKLILLNFLYLFLILFDGFMVIFVRKGLEDKWCCLSILFFICANALPLWILEINYGSFLSINIFNPEFMHHYNSHYKHLNETFILKQVNLSNGATLDLDDEWQRSIDKQPYAYKLERHEALFCLILITSCILIPHPNLSWSAISAWTEFTFNTILDIYMTIIMCRDARSNLSKSIVIACYVISTGALLPISLNIYSENEDQSDSLKISKLRMITDNFYFRFTVQIVLSDLPFLILRLIILKNLKFVKKDMYYLIVKQIIIIICKITVMIYNWVNEFIKNHIETN